MADRRYLARSIADSSQVAALIKTRGPWAGLVWERLIPNVDDDGRIVADPEILRSRLLPHHQDEVSVSDVEEALLAAHDLGLLTLYEVADAPGERYAYLPKFARHQTLRADRYSPSRFPAPPAWRPDADHPYAKNPELRTTKRPRDERRTVLLERRVPSRAISGNGTPESRPRAVADSRPELDPAPDASVGRLELGAKPHVPPHHITSRTPSAERPARREDVSGSGYEGKRETAPGEATEEEATVPTATRAMRPDCGREGCGDPWFVHRSQVNDATAAYEGDCAACARRGVSCSAYQAERDEPGIA